MNFEEFLEPRDKSNNSNEPLSDRVGDIGADSAAGELDVQKAVVKELAADKAALDDEVSVKGQRIEGLENELVQMKGKLEQAKIEISRLQGEIVRLQGEISKSKEAVTAEQAKTARVQDELAAEREKQFDQQERNPNALALLDRDVELPDRFPGETRDQVLEVIQEARIRAEAEGRLRRAQVLEGVLLANEPNGTLAKKREELKKLFADNGNIVNGTVIEELKKLGLSHKNGEEYLLVDEIMKRAY